MIAHCTLIAAAVAISPRSVVDFGVQSDLVGWNDARRDPIRLVFGLLDGLLD